MLQHRNDIIQMFYTDIRIYFIVFTHKPLLFKVLKKTTKITKRTNRKAQFMSPRHLITIVEKTYYNVMKSGIGDICGSLSKWPS